MKAIVAQLGARMHYAVPRMLHSEQMLKGFYTDAAFSQRSFYLVDKLLAMDPPLAARRMLNRKVAGVDPALIFSDWSLGLEYAVRRSRTRDANSLLELSLKTSARFSSRVGKLADISPGNIAFGFNSAALEFFLAAKQRGGRCMLEQTIAPKAIEFEILSAYGKKYPQWSDIELLNPALLASFCSREKEEWKLADLIVCGSDFVRDSIGAAGGDINKCVVIPYGVKRREVRPSPRYWDGRRNLKVLVAGAVGLRKGFPLIEEFARAHHGWCDLRIVGPITCGSECIDSLRMYTDVRGAVPRPEMSGHYEWADVFLLPSLCEGSATVTYEAMQYGLPVICTHNTGSIVEQGKSGLILREASVEGLFDAFDALRARPELIREFSAGSILRGEYASEDRYAVDLLAAFRSLS